MHKSPRRHVLISGLKLGQISIGLRENVGLRRAGVLQLCLKQGRIFRVLQQVVFGEDLAEVRCCEVVVGAFEGQQEKLLKLPVIDINCAGSRVLRGYRQEQNSPGHLNPAGGYGFPDLEKRSDYEVNVGLWIAKSKLSYAEQAVGGEDTSAELHKGSPFKQMMNFQEMVNC
ncbi:MAG: hypothetical protein ACRD4F_17720 [Candidatus Angelobacter sp.]